MNSKIDFRNYQFPIYCVLAQLRTNLSIKRAHLNKSSPIYHHSKHIYRYKEGHFIII